MAVVEVEHLSKLFVRGNNRVEAIHDLSLRVGDGEFVTIVGPSGCGKSTLLHILGGFVLPRCAGRCASTAARSTARARPRHDVPGSRASSPGARCAGNVGWALEVQGRAARRARGGRGAAPRAHRAPGLPARLSHRAVGRHAPARRPGPRAGLRAGGPAHGRALRRAGRADPRAACRRSCSASGSRRARPCCSSPTTSTRPSTSATASWCSPPGRARSRPSWRSACPSRATSR